VSPTAENDADVIAAIRALHHVEYDSDREEDVEDQPALR
jgi:hypothetical protein